MTLILLMTAAFLAGAINSVAGGGSFLTFPSLIFSGVTPIMANASSTVALVPGTIASMFAYRADIVRMNEKDLKFWFVVSLAGGALGAWLLLVTSDKTFRQIAPWLLLFATVLFAFGNRISTAMKGALHGNRWLMLLMLFPVAVYGGYFGGGIGIMFLAALRLYGMNDIHGMNGIKTILGGTLNTLAALIFIVMAKVSWHQTLMMMVASIAGGYAGPWLARRMRPAVIRGIVIGVGIVMTAYFFRISPR